MRNQTAINDPPPPESTMNQENNFPANLQLQERSAHIAKVLEEAKKVTIEVVADCNQSLNDAVSRLDDLQSTHHVILEKIKNIRQQAVSESERLCLERDKAQVNFDMAMKGDDETKQVAAAKDLSLAQMSVEHAKLLGPDALRLRALESQEATSFVNVKTAKEEVNIATERLRKAAFQKALIEYDEAANIFLKAAIRLCKANNACEKRDSMPGFDGSSIYIGSGHRVISHLQNPKDEPVTIGGYYFNSLMTQGSATDF
jgi:hypothetical protein